MTKIANDIKPSKKKSNKKQNKYKDEKQFYNYKKRFKKHCDFKNKEIENWKDFAYHLSFHLGANKRFKSLKQCIIFVKQEIKKLDKQLKEKEKLELIESKPKPKTILRKRIYIR